MSSRVLERRQSVANHDTLMAAKDTTALLLGINPSRMLVSSTGTFTTNDRIKIHLIFSLRLLLLSKKTIPV